MKFNGTYQEIKEKIRLTGEPGEWKELGNNGNQKQFHSLSGIVVNWWETSKTLQIQGAEGETRTRFEELLGKALRNGLTQSEIIPSPISNYIPTSDTKKIFIVHGHDNSSLSELELFIRRLNLSPYILKNAGESGKTIIEALEQRIVNDSSFGIVLMTPDDVGCSEKEYRNDNTNLKSRARQNVILEMGILIGAIGRNKVAILKKENIEAPSDVNGILYIPFNNSIIRDAGISIIKHLKQAGIPIDGKIITSALS